MKKLSLIILLLLLVAGAGAGAGYWFLVLEADDGDEEEQVNHTPTARILMEPADGKVGVGENLSLSGHLSSDPDGDPLVYNWDFDDGNTSSGLMATHTWGAEGNYSVTLTVRDPADATDSHKVQVTVSNGSVYTDDRSGDVQCPLTGGSCNSEEQDFPVEADAARVALGWDLTDERTLTTSEVSISVFNGAGDEIFSDTYNAGNFSVEFSGGQVDSVGNWTWRIEATAGAMSYELSIRVEY
ncbi:MAG: PKD domain-containing protein [Candidatus Poseidoniia archaeon]|nr:PKD domain-containing protein [Candidatus Poseidoniia archaeon]